MLAVLAVSLAAACSRRPDVAQRTAPNGVALAPNITCPQPDCSTYNVAPYVLRRSRYGIACLGNVPPGTTPNPEPPPQSYAVADIGRPGVPALTPYEAALVRRVVRAVKSPTLRVAWVDAASTPRGFIIFDAAHGPCDTGGPDDVYNGSCNEMYEPGENPYHTMAVPDCFPDTRRWH